MRYFNGLVKKTANVVTLLHPWLNNDLQYLQLHFIPKLSPVVLLQKVKQKTKFSEEKKIYILFLSKIVQSNTTATHLQTGHHEQIGDFCCVIDETVPVQQVNGAEVKVEQQSDIKNTILLVACVCVRRAHSNRADVRSYPDKPSFSPVNQFSTSSLQPTPSLVKLS